jgi:hypothetical protein
MHSNREHSYSMCYYNKNVLLQDFPLKAKIPGEHKRSEQLYSRITRKLYYLGES